jgi:hypothetical protein
MNYTEGDYACMLAGIRERILLQNFVDYVNSAQTNALKIIKVSKVESKSKWDAVILSGGVQYLTECKVRDKVKMYDNWILQEDKFIAITGLTNSSRGIALGMRGFYINFFKDGTILWDMNNDNGITFQDRDSKTTTAFSSGRKIKSVCYMSNASGKVYSYVNDIVKSTQQAKIIFRWLFPDVAMPNDGIWSDNYKAY